MFNYLPLYFKNISNMNKYLKSNNLNYTNYSLFSNYYVFLLNSSTENKYFLRINKHNGFFKYSNPLAGMDLIVENDKIKINYFMIYDKICCNAIGKIYGEELLNENESNEIKKFLLNYAEKIAKKNNLKVIQCDVHENLKRFNNYFKNEGFELTDMRCNDNGFWIETYKKL